MAVATVVVVTVVVANVVVAALATVAVHSEHVGMHLSNSNVVNLIKLIFLN